MVEKTECQFWDTIEKGKKFHVTRSIQQKKHVLYINVIICGNYKIDEPKFPAMLFGVLDSSG